MILRTSNILRTGIGKGQYHISLMTVVLTSVLLVTKDFLDNHISILLRADVDLSQPLLFDLIIYGGDWVQTKADYFLCPQYN